MKKMHVIFGIFVFFFFSSKVNALTIKPVSNVSKANKGETITITILVSRSEGDSKVSAVDAMMNYDKNMFEVVSSTNLTNWREFLNGAHFSIGDITFTDAIKESSKNIYQYKLKIKGSASGSSIISTTINEVTDENGDSIEAVGGSTTIGVKSTVNTLDSLTVSSGNLTPSFDKNTTSYTLTTTDSSIDINAILTDSNAKLTGVGKVSLNYGTNTIKIIVTSESGSSKTYSIVVTRPDNRSTDNFLASLIPSVGSLKFNKTITSYKMEVASNTTKISFTTTLNDSKASYTNWKSGNIVSLNYGINNLTIGVKAENGSVRNYTITIIREDNRDSNNYLKNLLIEGYDINFNETKYNYNLEVENIVTNLNITALSSSAKAKVTIDNKILNVGENIININVTAENETTKTYTIKVIRKNAEEITSPNPIPDVSPTPSTKPLPTESPKNEVKLQLDNLEIVGFNIDFVNDKYTYTIKSKKDLDSLEIKYKVNENINVEILDNNNLKTNSIVKIKLTDINNNQTIYNIKIVESSNNYFLLMISSAFFLVGLGTLILVIRKTKTPKKKEYVWEFADKKYKGK